ncbi:hypothetical protein A2V54_03080 [candidate division WWE3 bacterium RBG_19FT_COMBO_53_11]|uniref:Peptidase C39 domain-containing protein n=1 Tax=candidate division WWE3 bacterium RBG_19FT_COMBO_53_11 TaxID=1802613 RepID=A0A1F4UHE5_UNCKA|nr:MAG: hypothetical protein A2155_02640 [candidate division WWE3 bacterium RBG_16_52_45]OGC44339.1 MAG: hypothetical protein A2V54_03080 [candidate division WWE3 bacterium RBG_19FT_COMBO_53_11]
MAKLYLPPDLAGLYERQENRRIERVDSLKRHHEKSSRFRRARNFSRRYRVQKIARLSGVNVWLVDGTGIRRDVDVDFTMGGHAYRYLYIPPNEIWVESSLAEGDLWPTIWHEFTERRMMRAGLNYDRAHTYASRLEIVLRDGRTFVLPVGTFRQTEGLCGPAALKIVAEYHGYNFSEPHLARLCHTTKEKGTDPADIIRAARKLRFTAWQREHFTVEMVKETLKRGLPIIANFQLTPDFGEGHYAVIIGFTAKEFILSDPQEDAGYRKVPIKKFMGLWYELEDKTAAQGIIVSVP